MFFGKKLTFKTKNPTTPEKNTLKKSTDLNVGAECSNAQNILNTEQSNMSISESNNYNKKYLAFNVNLPESCATDTDEELLKNFRFDKQNKKLSCTICDWFSINNSVEELLAHSKTSLHKNNLKKRFENKNSCGRSESSMIKNQKAKHNNQNQDLNLLNNELLLKILESFENRSDQPNNFSPQMFSDTARKNLEESVFKSQKPPSNRLHNSSEMLNKTDKSTKQIITDVSNKNVKEKEDLVIDFNQFFSKIEKKEKPQKTTSRWVKVPLSETSDGESYFNPIKFSEDFEGLSIPSKGRTTSESSNQKTQKNKKQNQTRCTEKKNVVYEQCSKQKQKAKSSHSIKKTKSFEDFSSNSNCSAQTSVFPSSARKPNFENKKTFQKNEDCQALPIIFLDNQALKIVSNKTSHNNSTKTVPKAFKNPPKKKKEVSTSSTAQENPSLPKDMAFISFTPNKNAKCGICDITIPFAKDFKNLMENVNCHINGIKHINKKKSLKGLLNKAAEALD